MAASRKGPACRYAALVAEGSGDLAHRIRSDLARPSGRPWLLRSCSGTAAASRRSRRKSCGPPALPTSWRFPDCTWRFLPVAPMPAWFCCWLLVPSAPLRWPTHKWAALAALAAAVLYLLLSGAAVATQRSFLMIALVFLGHSGGPPRLDVAQCGARRSATPGALRPERSVLSRDFRCPSLPSFAWWRSMISGGGARDGFSNTRPEALGAVHRMLTFLGKWVLGLFVTALVAGLATGIIGAHHFGRVSRLSELSAICSACLCFHFACHADGRAWRWC